MENKDELINLRNPDRYNGLTLKKLENVNLFELLYTSFDALIYNGCTKRKLLFRIIKSFFVSYSKKGSGPIAFVYTHAVGQRKDHPLFFRNLCETYSDNTIVSPKKYGFNIYAILNLRMIRMWKKQLRSNFTNKEASILSIQLFRTYVQALLIMKKVKRSKLILTYCDALYVDYLVTVMANKQGFETATVQHGFYLKNSYYYWHTKSKYMIANSNIGCERSKANGLENVYLGGLLSEIGSQPNHSSSKPIYKKFALILDVSINNEKHKIDNEHLIDFSRSVCKEKGLTCIIRFHPADLKSLDLTSISSDQNFEISTNETIDELLTRVDFIIVNQSTVVLSSIYRLVPFCRYIGESGDLIPEMNTNVFSSIDQLSNLINNIYCLSQGNELEKIRDTVIGVVDTKKQYQLVFEKLISEIK